jgi:hypothetical protein
VHPNAAPQPRLQDLLLDDPGPASDQRGTDHGAVQEMQREASKQGLTYEDAIRRDARWPAAKTLTLGERRDEREAAREGAAAETKREMRAESETRGEKKANPSCHACFVFILGTSFRGWTVVPSVCKAVPPTRGAPCWIRPGKFCSRLFRTGGGGSFLFS